MVASLTLIPYHWSGIARARLRLFSVCFGETKWKAESTPHSSSSAPFFLEKEGDDWFIQTRLRHLVYCVCSQPSRVTVLWQNKEKRLRCIEHCKRQYNRRRGHLKSLFIVMMLLLAGLFMPRLSRLPEGSIIQVKTRIWLFIMSSDTYRNNSLEKLVIVRMKMTHSTPENSDTTGPAESDPWDGWGGSDPSKGHVSLVLGCPMQGADAEHVENRRRQGPVPSLCAEVRTTSCPPQIMDRKVLGWSLPILYCC